MTGARRALAGWVIRPQRTRLRGLLASVHLWIGLALGVYVVVICVSGSVAVFRPDVSLAAIPRAVETVGSARLDAPALREAVRRQYPERRITRASEPRRPESLVQVALADADGDEIDRLVDPYTGQVVGDPYPPVVRAMEWVVRLHDDLLAGSVGRTVNGVAGGLVVALVLTGAAIWWPGTRRWPVGFLPRRGGAAPRFLWQLHALLGFWTGALLFVWALTGFYFAFPQPFNAVMDFLAADRNAPLRPGEALLIDLVDLHFGRFGGLAMKAVWAVLGLVPAALFASGFLLWWRRAVRPRARARLSLSEEHSQIDDRRVSASEV